MCTFRKRAGNFLEDFEPKGPWPTDPVPLTRCRHWNNLSAVRVLVIGTRHTDEYHHSYRQTCRIDYPGTGLCFPTIHHPNGWRQTEGPPID